MSDFLLGTFTFWLLSFFQTQESEFLSQFNEKLHGKQVSIAPTAILISDSSSSAGDSYQYCCLSSNEGILIYRNEKAESRYIYNTRYGFRVNQLAGSNKWILAKIDTRKVIRARILADWSLNEANSLGGIPLRQILEDSSFVIDRSAVDNFGNRTIEFKCDVGEDGYQEIKGGNFAIDEEGNLLSYQAELLFIERPAKMSGIVQRMNGGIESRYTVTVDGKNALTRSVETIDSTASTGITLDNKSPFWMTSYGFPEPPRELSWMVPYIVFGILVLVGAGLIVYSKLDRK
jgi:hypothetical protein